MAVGAVVARILTQYSDKGSKAAQKDIAKLGKNIDGFSKKATRAFGLAAAASAALAVKIGKDAVQAAISDQKSQALLANTLRNTTGATEGAIAGVENYVTSLQKQFSVVDDELRPAMARLVGVTGSITAAQSLMDTALNVSAKSGADLATSVGAIIKATTGQFKSLKALVPELSNTTIKSKNVAKAFEEVNKASAGAAATRANTLEYRLKGINIAYGEILETLGYALLPVIEKFATAITTKILPAFEAWITLNKDKLATSFQTAVDFGSKLLAVAFALSQWASDHKILFEGLAIIISGMWAVGKIAAFVTAIKTVTTAMAGLRTTALGAAVASAFATGGISAAAGGIAVAGILAAVGVGLAAPGTTSGGSGKSGKSGGNPLPKLGASGAVVSAATPKNYTGHPSMGGSKIPTIVTTGKTLEQVLADLAKTMNTTTTTTKALLTAKQKELNLKLKELGITTTAQQDAITQFAIINNLQKQAKLSGSSTIAIGASGSLPYGNSGSTTINISAGSIVGSKEALVDAVRNGLEQLRSRGSLFESYAV